MVSKKTSSKQDAYQSFKVKGEDLLKEIKELLHQGNVRKILIKDEKGQKTYLEIPVTIGVIGTLIAPVLAAIGALAAMVGFVTVEVVNEEKGNDVQRSSMAKKVTKTSKKTAPGATKTQAKKTTTARKR